jgi:CDGSH-type Zn-finger protein
MIWGQTRHYKIAIDRKCRLTYAAYGYYEVHHMADPTIAQKAPFGVDVESGKTYFWCACGKSGNQPFCDGSHSGTEFTPVKFEAVETKQVFFCGCKFSKNKPLCDGSHGTL